MTNRSRSIRRNHERRNRVRTWTWYAQITRSTDGLAIDDGEKVEVTVDGDTLQLWKMIDRAAMRVLEQAAAQGLIEVRQFIQEGQGKIRPWPWPVRAIANA